MKNVFFNKFLYFIFGGIIFGSIGVYAATTYSSNSIIYKSSDGDKNLNTVLDELYPLKSKGNATADEIAAGKTVVVKGQVITGTGANETAQYNKGLQDGKRDIINMTGKNMTDYDSFVCHGTQYVNQGKDVNCSKTITIPLMRNDGPIMNFGFQESGYTGKTSYSYESVTLSASYRVYLDNGVTIQSGSFNMTTATSAAQPTLPWRMHTYNIFDYDTAGANNIKIDVSCSMHLQGGTGTYSQSGGGVWLNSVYAYYLQ